LICETVGTASSLRAGLDLHRVPLQIEHVEVAARHVHGHVVDGHRADRALEAARVGVAVEDDVRPVLRDRRREAVAAEVRPDPLGLAEQRVGGRGVVEEDDADGAVRYLLQAVVDRVDLRGRLGVAPPQQRLPEVGQGRAGEPPDEALCPDDPDLAVGELADGRRAVEHVDPGFRADRRDLVAMAGVEVVVAQNRADGDRQIAARPGDDDSLLGLAMGRQVAGEEDQVGVALDARERLLDAGARRLGRVDVSCSRDPDHASHVPRAPTMGNRAAMPGELDEEFRQLLETMKKAGRVLRDVGIPHALGGGLACWARGGPESEHDVDFLVRPEDADRALEALGEAGFRTERPPEGWLLKAHDGEILVDLIFDPQGGRVDDAMLERSEELEVLAMRLPVASLEDVLVQKLLALTEQEPDYSSVLEIARALREQIDWDEVRRRTEESPFAQAFFTLLDELDIVQK
jgi:hypothetical protein